MADNDDMGIKSREKWERRLARAYAVGVENGNPSPPQSLTSKLFRFFEHPLFTLPVGIIGGVMGLLYTPVFAVCGICFILAFHRSEVVGGRSWKIQIPSYAVIFIAAFALVFACKVGIKKAVHVPTWQEFADRVWIGHSLPSQTIINNRYETTVPPSPEKIASLQQRTSLLADQLLGFAYAREGPINSWKQQAMAQSFLDAINKRDSDGFQARLAAWNQQTNQQFVQLYWPKVQSLEDDLISAGVDTSPISRAVASDSPRKVALMLSVLADRVGRQPPYERTLTPLEARAIVQGLGGVQMEVYADKADINSTKIAEVLHKEFVREKWKVNPTILALPKATPPLSGIHIVFPSPDLTVNFEGMIEAFNACELETNVDVRGMKQPPTILKIEVWASKAEPSPFPTNQLIRP